MQLILDATRCTGCGICVQVCPQMILELADGAMCVRDASRCMGCFGCEDECPEHAVRVLRAPQGVTEIPIEPSAPGRRGWGLPSPAPAPAWTWSSSNGCRTAR
jgi:NAD-dependent dihydropyrimidine dehydrogenase PreA subunit